MFCSQSGAKTKPPLCVSVNFRFSVFVNETIVVDNQPTGLEGLELEPVRWVAGENRKGPHNLRLFATIHTTTTLQTRQQHMQTRQQQFLSTRSSLRWIDEAFESGVRTSSSSFESSSSAAPRASSSIQTTINLEWGWQPRLLWCQGGLREQRQDETRSSVDAFGASESVRSVRESSFIENRG